MLLVGDVEFKELAAPEYFTLGGEQKIPVKELPGGSIILQPRGYFFNTEQSWDGSFVGVDAIDKAQTVQKYARTAESVAVAFGPFSLRYFVEKFYFRWVREDWVDFSITLRRDLTPVETQQQTVGPIETQLLSTQVTASPAATPTTHVVVSGESLWKIAQRYKTTVDALYTANKKVIGPNPNMIQPGMRLVIP